MESKLETEGGDLNKSEAKIEIKTPKVSISQTVLKMTKDFDDLL